jgi:hypothetical protein
VNDDTSLGCHPTYISAHHFFLGGVPSASPSAFLLPPPKPILIPLPPPIAGLAVPLLLALACATAARAAERTDAGSKAPPALVPDDRTGANPLVDGLALRSAGVSEGVLRCDNGTPSVGVRFTSGGAALAALAFPLVFVCEGFERKLARNASSCWGAALKKANRVSEQTRDGERVKPAHTLCYRHSIPWSPNQA